MHEQQVVMVTNKKNGLGLTGFVLAIIALFVGEIPIIGWVVWLLGAVFSVIGLFKMPRGFAIAGTIISFIGLIMIIVIGGIIASIFGANM
ncbi:hypothetical protein AB3K25_01500 [Leuconostoc sp. MS02]|uniref:Integral membrane protein n=1 Tax=Leuconostoc aquikimchii TaxID=3236804 RepID=A0ABV3S5R0_9LACO